MRILRAVLLSFAPAVAALAAPRPVKVVVVSTFESGADTGDRPGEFQFWAEREQWNGHVSVPGVDHPVYVSDDGVLGVVSGTTVRASNQIMALVLGGQFDFSKAYWLINGIAGVDPADASIGSAAWSRWVIDGDIAYEIDSREADASWPYGVIAIGAKAPNEKPAPQGWEPDVMAYPLHPGLVAWAYALTRKIDLPDTAEMQSYRALYEGFPNAQKPPFVLLGESFGSCRYWHGRAMTQWANDWTTLWTEGQGNFVMTDMEDQGIATALTRLEKMGRADFGRVLFLRTASNYCMQAPKQAVDKSLHAEYAGLVPSLESAYRAGSKVVREIVTHWDQFAVAPPTSP